MNRAIEEMRANALRAKLDGTLDWMRERADVMYDPKAIDRMVRKVSRVIPDRVSEGLALHGLPGLVARLRPRVPDLPVPATSPLGGSLSN